MKIARRFSGAAIGAALAFAFAAPASASTIQDLEPVSPRIAVSNATTVEQLEELVGTQTADEIDRIANSGTPGAPAQLLVNPQTGETLAAIKPEPSVTTFALTQTAPGCASGGLCMKSKSGTPYGYIGTGSLSGTWSGINYVSAGNQPFTFKMLGVYNYVNRYQEINYTGGGLATITWISRG